MKHFYLSAGGCDTAPGTKEHPFATWEAARDAVRPFAGKEAVTVHIAPGEYTAQGITFTAENKCAAGLFVPEHFFTLLSFGVM